MSAANFHMTTEIQPRRLLLEQWLHDIKQIEVAPY